MEIQTFLNAKCPVLPFIFDVSYWGNKGIKGQEKLLNSATGEELTIRREKHKRLVRKIHVERKANEGAKTRSFKH